MEGLIVSYLVTMVFVIWTSPYQWQTELGRRSGHHPLVWEVAVLLFAVIWPLFAIRFILKEIERGW